MATDFVGLRAIPFSQNQIRREFKHDSSAEMSWLLGTRVGIVNGYIRYLQVLNIHHILIDTKYNKCLDYLLVYTIFR